MGGKPIHSQSHFLRILHLKIHLLPCRGERKKEEEKKVSPIETQPVNAV
jgi:hypothetical protein